MDIPSHALDVHEGEGTQPREAGRKQRAIGEDNAVEEDAGHGSRGVAPMMMIDWGGGFSHRHILLI